MYQRPSNFRSKRLNFPISVRSSTASFLISSSAAKSKACKHKRRKRSFSSASKGRSLATCTTKRSGAICKTLYSFTALQYSEKALNTYKNKVSPATFLPEGSQAISSTLPCKDRKSVV